MAVVILIRKTETDVAPVLGLVLPPILALVHAPPDVGIEGVVETSAAVGAESTKRAWEGREEGEEGRREGEQEGGKGGQLRRKSNCDAKRKEKEGEEGREEGREDTVVATYLSARAASHGQRRRPCV